MKVLWTVNLIPREAANVLHLPSEVLGGWVEAMSAQLRQFPNIQLTIACKCEKQDFCETINGITYCSLNYSSPLEPQCEAIINSARPSLIHIEGTEFPHALTMMQTARKAGVPTIISLQGILNGQYNYQCGQLPMDDMMLSTSLTSILTAWLLHLRKTRWYKPRLQPERELLAQAEYILGRTTWDRAHAYALNPHARYFSCSRVLRQPFYEVQWKLDRMERHSLYVGNGYYALKGLHFVLQALPLLKREYPDVKLYVAGHKPYQDKDSRPFYKKAYGSYLHKLIQDLGVVEQVVFTGPLQADQVAEKLSRVNVYVLCSAIENSPNTLGEAMLVGTPCVAAYVGGVPDMAVDQEEALFYRNDDPVLLAWNIKRIFDDDKLAQKLSANARQHALITHDPQRNAQQLIDAYQNVLKN
ncbi:MAG TPA: glycosyltransferase family 4 protein [Lentisphaeria bacterium]|nr:glycosyltransferase family 4 protein [Lentisphaeria bacterium]